MTRFGNLLEEKIAEFVASVESFIRVASEQSRNYGNRNNGNSKGNGNCLISVQQSAVEKLRLYLLGGQTGGKQTANYSADAGCNAIDGTC